MRVTICDLRCARLRCVAAITWSLALLGNTEIRAESILLTGATVHTVSGETLSPGQVWIQDDKIAAVGKSVSASGAKVVELKGQHVYPGLINLDTELGLVEITAVRATLDLTEVGEYTPDVQSWMAVNPDSELLAVARANGIAYFEPVPQGGVVTGQSGLVRLDGWTMEQMAYKKPAALHVFWPDMSLNTAPRERSRSRANWKSLEEQARARRAKLRELADFFEEARAYARATAAGRTNATLLPLKTPAWESMLPYVRGELPITVHANDVREIKAAVAWALTNQFKIILADARDAWMLADLLATNQIPVIYKYVFTQPQRDTDAYDAPYHGPAVLAKAGVKVALSKGASGDEGSLVKNQPYEAAQAQAFGLSAEEALKAITLYPAQIIGVADRLGSIEPGKEATLFVADGDILDIRTNVKRMWIAGREVSLESRHTRLYEKYKNRPKP